MERNVVYVALRAAFPDCTAVRVNDTMEGFWCHGDGEPQPDDDGANVRLIGVSMDAGDGTLRGLDAVVAELRTARLVVDPCAPFTGMMYNRGVGVAAHEARVIGVLHTQGPRRG